VGVVVVQLLRVMCDVLHQEAAITTDGGVLQWAGEVSGSAQTQFCGRICFGGGDCSLSSW
jgi:hypothetical protein